MARQTEVAPRFVVDASVVLKWFVSDNERDVERALRLRQDFLDGAVQLLAPELIAQETANVIRFKPRTTAAAVTRAIASLWQMEFIRPVGTDVCELAIALAFELDATVYDTTYLALAELSQATLVTADRKFYRKAAGRESVVLLGGM